MLAAIVIVLANVTVLYCWLIREIIIIMKTLLKYTFYLYTIVNLALIKVIYNWLHESHKTTNIDLNGYTCNVFNTN